MIEFARRGHKNKSRSRKSFEMLLKNSRQRKCESRSRARLHSELYSLTRLGTSLQKNFYPVGKYKMEKIPPKLIAQDPKTISRLQNFTSDNFNQLLQKTSEAARVDGKCQTYLRRKLIF